MPKETFFNLSKDKRALIEKVAIEEFANNGLKAASVNAIVSNASIAKGSFINTLRILEISTSTFSRSCKKRRWN